MKHLLVGALLLLSFVAMLPQTVHALDGTGHYDDTVWYGIGAGYNNISVDITPEVWDGGSDGYFYANNATFSNQQNIYAGLQTNGYSGSQWVGKMAIFSIWNVDGGIAEPGGSGTSFGGEGTGYSVRLPFNWQIGTTYRLTIYLDQDIGANRLWAASLTNMTTGGVTRIGRIYAPNSYGKIGNPVTFHERYMGENQNCSAIQPSQVRFTNMLANGTSQSNSWNHYVTKAIPECPSAVWTQNLSNGYVNGIGTSQASSTPTSSPQPATPTTPQTTKQKTPAPAPNQTKISSKPTANVTTSPKAPTAQTSNPNSTWPLLASLFLLCSICLGVISMQYFRAQQFKRLIQKHFPYDFDIHGTTKG